MEEEFNNFMQKVTEVSNIVKNLTSEDSNLNQIGIIEADKYLNNGTTKLSEDIDEQGINLKLKCDKTVINKKSSEEMNDGRMSQEVFMKEIEKDAKKRYKNRQIRIEQCNTIKTKANKRFAKGEYEKALNLYNQAIELIRDSAVLYNNRALTYMNLNFYEKAIKDCETALKLNENSLKAWLYMGKCYFLLDNEHKSNECITEAIERNPKSKSDIESYIAEFRLLKRNV